MNVWIGMLGITINSNKKAYIENLEKRFFSYVNEKEGQLQIELVETNYKPEQTKKCKGCFWFTMFSDNIYVYVDSATYKGKIYICEDTPAKFDALDSVLIMIAAHFLPMYSSMLVHGCCLSYKGKSYCFLGESGSGKSTICKIFGDEANILAEDMFVLECYENKVVANSIPLGQKHFWVASGKYLQIENIVFIREGKLRIENDLDSNFLIKILNNQFFMKNECDQHLVEYMYYNICRLKQNTKSYNLYWEPEIFYQKNRKYLWEIKQLLGKIQEKENNSREPEKFNCVLNEWIMHRPSVDKRGIEIWDASVHRLFGITASQAKIFVYMVSVKKIEINSILEDMRIRGIPEKETLDIINEFTNKGIFRKERV